MSDLTAAMIANDERRDDSDTAAVDKLIEGLRLSIRQHQLDLMANPDPTSPWWFLADSRAEFRT